jgi:hypothetical protein
MEGLVLVAVLLLIVIVPLVGLISQAKKRAAHEARLRALALSDIDNMDGVMFEHYVAKLLRHEGYTEVDVSKGSGDFGVDIVASKDSRRYAIPVKRWSGTVSRTAVSDAVAGKGHYSCNAAMVVTNSYLSAKSREFASSVGCEIVDRDILGGWVLRFQASGPAPRTPPTPVYPPIGAWRLDSGPGPRTPPTPVTRKPESTSPPGQLDTPLPNPPIQRPAEPKSSALAGGLPSGVLQSIKQSAASHHPGDFSTQVYVIEKQRKAYEKLQRFRPQGIPQEIFTEMLSRTTQHYPSDYSTQMYVLEDHVQSYFALANLRVHDVPFETLTE